MRGCGRCQQSFSHGVGAADSFFIGSGGLADVSAVGDVVRVGGAAERDGSAWRAQPPVRSRCRLQRWVAFEQKPIAAALLRRTLGCR